MLSNDTLLKFLQSSITEQHCFQNWMSKFICSTLRKAGNLYNNKSYPIWPRGRLNSAEPRNNMIYVSYEFYLIHLLFTLIILHHFHMCPSPFFSMFSLPRHDRDALLERTQCGPQCETQCEPHCVSHCEFHTVKFERFNSVNQRDHSVNTLFFTLCFTVWSHCETQCGPHCVFHSVFHCVDARFSTVWAHCVHSVGTPFTLLKRSNLTLWNIHHTVNNHHTVKHPLWTTVWTHWPVFWSRI